MSTFKESVLIPKDSFLRLTSKGKIAKRNKDVRARVEPEKDTPSTRYILYEAKRARRRDKARNSVGVTVKTPKSFGSVDLEHTPAPDPYEKHILKWFSPKDQAGIFRIVKAMREHPGIIRWDEQNFELTINDGHLPGSNMIDILTFLVSDEDEDRYYSSAKYTERGAGGVPLWTHKFVLVMQKIFAMSDNSKKLYATLRFNPEKVEKAKQKSKAAFNRLEELLGKRNAPERLMRRSMNAIEQMELEKPPVTPKTVGERIKETLALSEGATPLRTVGSLFDRVKKKLLPSPSLSDVKTRLFFTPAEQMLEQEEEKVADELPTVEEQVKRYKTRRPEERRAPAKYSPSDTY